MDNTYNGLNDVDPLYHPFLCSTSDPINSAGGENSYINTKYQPWHASHENKSTGRG